MIDLCREQGGLTPPCLFRELRTADAMTRRSFLQSFLAIGLALTASPPASAHTPYRQWKVLRERFLLIHSCRTDLAGDEIAEQLVALMKTVLPEANAMVARAPDEQRIASLMTSGQAMLAVLRADLASDLYLQRGDYSEFDGGQLRSLARVGDHLLVSVASFPRHHAWLVAAALLENGQGIGVRALESEPTVPLHDGAAAYLRGESLESQK